MPGGAVTTVTDSSETVDERRVEAPVTFKTYLMCAFAAFGGIFFGYDSGYISGVLSMDYFIETFEDLDKATTPSDKFVIPSSLKVSHHWFGRRFTIIAGCIIFIIGVVLQTASTGLGLLVAGRLIAGFGVGFVSAVIIMYMSEIAPRKVRGAIVSGYQFCITIGLMLASCVDYGTENRSDSGSYRIPIALQMLWAVILAGKKEEAVHALARIRGQPQDSEYIQAEINEIEANFLYEMQVIPQDGYFNSWLNCFRGNIFHPNSNVRRTVLGTSLQMMQQWTGVNFVFYFGTPFFTQLGTIQNPFLITMITTIVNVCSTPISFYAIEKVGRRPLLLWGALGMVICQFLVAIIGVTDGDNNKAVSAMIAFICIYIFFFASTWGPGAWVVIGQPGSQGFLHLGISLHLRLCLHLLPHPETKGLTLEQVDKMMEETTPRTSAKWKPHTTFAVEMGLDDEKSSAVPQVTQHEV
ncbi:Major facilitator superfamily domain general substrate transporter [Penicillium hetheringtonii]|uniref:Major facilitator superfamily domain general substrate transporter n=1 Tax=Penicillium hetheringtonii TaxID=911720 RepID=A0AAD6H1I8_9EURO|nr:Major facilitator superfamily domain general substrate transporter [Penicillium hetheringtonii]